MKKRVAGANRVAGVDKSRRNHRREHTPASMESCFGFSSAHPLDVQNPGMLSTAAASFHATEAQRQLANGGDHNLIQKHIMERFRTTPNHRLRTDIAFLRTTIEESRVLFRGLGDDDEPSKLPIREMVRAIHGAITDGNAPADWRDNADTFLLDLTWRWQSETSAALREKLTYHPAGTGNPPNMEEALDMWVAEGRKRAKVMFGI